jgi:mycothiol synthase
MRAIETLSPIAGPGRAEALDLLADVRAQRGIEPLSENKVIGLKRGHRSSAGFYLRENGALDAYAHLEVTDTGFACEVVTAPASPQRRDEMMTSLLAAVIAAVRSRGGGALSYFLVDPSDSDERMAKKFRFFPTRELLVLRRTNSPDDLATAAPALSPFRPGIDEDAWIALNARAFAWHPEQGSWTRTDLEEREDEEWFSAEDLLCCWIDDRLAGTCWTKFHRGPDQVGEIYVMSVDPDFQGRGLGRHVLSHGVSHITAAGAPSTILYVEGDNDPALGLYRSFGFANSSRTLVATAQVPKE